MKDKCTKIRKYITLVGSLMAIGFIISFILFILCLCYINEAATVEESSMYTCIGVFIPMICLGIYYLGNEFIKKGRARFANEVITPILQNYLPRATFEAYQSDSILGDFVTLDLVKTAAYPRVTNYFKSNDKNEVEACSLFCKTGGKHKRIVYEGTQIVFKHDLKVDGVVRILCSNPIIGSYESTFVPKQCDVTPTKIDTGIFKLDDNFEIYASDAHTGFYVLNSCVIEKLIEMREMFGEYALAITPRYVFISLKGLDRFIHVPDCTSDMTEEYLINTRKQFLDMYDAILTIKYTISHSNN